MQKSSVLLEEWILSKEATNQSHQRALNWVAELEGVISQQNSQIEELRRKLNERADSKED